MPCINCKHARKDLLKKDTPCRTEKTIITTHIFCSYWIEVQQIFHKCNLYLKDNDSLIQSDSLPQLKKLLNNYFKHTKHHKIKCI